MKLEAWESVFRTGGCVGVALIVGCSGSAVPGPADATADSSAPFDAADAPAPAPAMEVDCGLLAWAGDGCAACTVINCCALEALCASIPSCSPLNVCSEACGADAGCAFACGAMYSAAASNYNAILNCQSNSCRGECGQ